MERLTSQRRCDQSTIPQEHGENRPDSSASVPDDHSWGQLNQVASVDSALARARMAEYEKTSEENKAYRCPTKEKEIRQPPSNSSSLTNSPVEAHDTVVEGKPNPSPSKLGPLDSLSSVASAQEPMETSPKASKETKPAANGPSSPGSSSGSLDLMKCHSGSSGLVAQFSWYSWTLHVRIEFSHGQQALNGCR